jgi:predicted nuclease of predicted toxin-antitoxin system
MPYRILADENIEPATRNYLAKLGHDIVFVPAVDELGESAPDGDIAACSREHDRLILTQDDDCRVAHRGRVPGRGVRRVLGGSLKGVAFGPAVGSK